MDRPHVGEPAHGGASETGEIGGDGKPQAQNRMRQRVGNGSHLHFSSQRQVTTQQHELNGLVLSHRTETWGSEVFLPNEHGYNCRQGTQQTECQYCRTPTVAAASSDVSLVFI